MRNDDIKTIEADLEQTRARTESTIEALQAKLQPRAVLDEATRFFKGTDGGAYAEDLTRNALAEARENPLPLLLIGAGSILLATKRPGRPKYIYEESDVTIRDGVIGSDYDYATQEDELSSLYDAEYEDTHRIIGASETIDRTYARLENEDDDAYTNRLYEARGKAFEIDRKSDEDDKSFRARIDEKLQGAKSKAGEYQRKAGDYRRRQTERASNLYHRAGDKTSSFYEGSKQRAGDFAHGTQDRASQLGHSAQERAAELRDGTRQAARRSVSATTDFYEEKPLVAAAAVLAAGALAGSFFSTTRREREALRPVAGEINDAARRLDHAANEKVQEYAERVQHLAEDAGDKVDEVAGETDKAQAKLSGSSNGGATSTTGTAKTDTTGYTPASQASKSTTSSTKSTS